MDSPKKKHEATGRHPIAAFFAFMAAWPSRFAAWLAASFLGRALLSYSKSRELLSESRLSRRFRESRIYAAASPLRYRIARLLSDSRPAVLCHKLLDMLRYTHTRTYGVLFGTFGLYTILVYVMKRFLFVGMEGDFGALVTGIVTVLLSLLLLFSGNPLCYDLQESRLLGFLLYRVVGLRRYPIVRGKHKPLSPALAFLFGTLLGITAFLWHPLLTLFGIFALIAFFLLLFSPELCLFSAILMAPFLIFVGRPSVLLCVIVLIGVVGYLLKLLLGKRLFSFEPLDFAVLFLGIAYILSAFFTYGGAVSTAKALMYAILLIGYFLAVNLLTSPVLVNRAINALLTGGTIVALIGLFQQFAGKAVADWLDNSAYDYISGRITSVFENPNILAAYLILIFPFAIAQLLKKTNALRRAGYFLVFVIFMAAIIYTWSRGAWIGAILALGLFLFACNPATIYLLIPVGVGLPFLLRWASDPFSLRLTSATLTDTSVSYRVHIWRGTWRMIGDHLLGGIGVGTDAFTAVYPYYALSGIETATHTHNLYLQYLVEFGIVGLLLLLLFVFLFFQCILTHQREEKDDGLRLSSIAAGCGVVAVLANGFADHVFYNSRVFFLFFIVVGIAVALSRVGKTEEERSRPIRDNGNEIYTVDIDVA